MNYDELTVESKSVLLTLYKAYLQRIKNGESRNQAREFFSFDNIHKTYFKDWTDSKTLLDIFRELGNEKWITNSWGSNTIAICDLNTQSIAFLQNRFKNRINKVIDDLLKLKKLFI